MAVDLLLDMDDDLLAWVEQRASVDGMSAEEFMRHALTTNVGRPYTPLNQADLFVERPTLYFDLSTGS